MKKEKENKIKFTRSDELWAKAKKLIPGGTQTLSKAPDQFVNGVTPKFLERGKGCHVWDVDGNEYIDYPMALGPILLGYDYAPVVEAVTAQIRKGTTFTLMHPLEVEVAELLVSTIPCAEMVRYAKNGTDVTTAAIRVARAHTGKDHIAFSGYHGCNDWYAITTPRNKGIPREMGRLIHPFKFNNIESLEAIFDAFPDKVGSVIMEIGGEVPVESKYFPSKGKKPDKKHFLHDVKELCRRRGALFILDEIVTGFRLSLGGAQEFFNVTPDLACFGKGMANGFPISALVGKKEYMRELEEVFFSMTYSGDTIGLSAAKATINILMNEPVLDYIWKKGEKLHAGMRERAADLKIPFEISGQPVRAGMTFRDNMGKESLDLKSLFLQETIKRGILFGGPVFITYSHTDEDIEKTLDAFTHAMKSLRKALDVDSVDPFMEGEKVKVIFRKRD